MREAQLIINFLSVILRLEYNSDIVYCVNEYSTSLFSIIERKFPLIPFDC